MTPAAEKDIRSALRQLRGCIGRLAMVRTAEGKLGPANRGRLEAARVGAQIVETRLLAMLNPDSK